MYKPYYFDLVIHNEEVEIAQIEYILFVDEKIYFFVRIVNGGDFIRIIRVEVKLD
jgi:hypothetical protein